MASMGFLLADWSIELIKSRKRKNKEKKNQRKGENLECGSQTEGYPCIQCLQKDSQINSQKEILTKHRDQWKRLSHLQGQGDDSSTVSEPLDFSELVEQLLNSSSGNRGEINRLKEENIRLTQSVGVQLADRDRVHADKIQTLELLALQKEKELLKTSNSLKQQLAEANQQLQHITARHQRIQAAGETDLSGGFIEAHQELESLRVVLDMRRTEIEQLRAANNSLLLELERWRGIDLRLQEQTQRLEESQAVVFHKNQDIRRLEEEHEQLQHQLEIEESAHMACQQELEKSQWLLESFLSNNKEQVFNKIQKIEKGLVMDFVHKDKSLAYSLNC